MEGFTFLSVFKLEDRKGWRELVAAYCHSFSILSNVTLVLHTYLYQGWPDPWDVERIRVLIHQHLDQVPNRLLSFIH